MRGRAYRRHQDRLAKRRTINYFRDIWAWPDQEPGRIGTWASTHRCPCSCWMCGNGRRIEGPTRQELVAELDQAEQEAEL